MKYPPPSGHVVSAVHLFQLFACITFVTMVVVVSLCLFGRDGQPQPRVRVRQVPTRFTRTPTTPAQFDVASEGFWEGLGSVRGHMFDAQLSRALVHFFKEEGARSVLELGCGLGQYAKDIRDSGLFVSCYDGNPDTQALTGGLCGVINLSKKIDLNVHDWVLSLEVGEHIPKQYEQVFLDNVHKHNAKGVVVSWAVEGQGGTSHVNNKNNSYVRGQIEGRGYRSDYGAEKTLRSRATLGWFRNTLMVFRKQYIIYRTYNNTF